MGFRVVFSDGCQRGISHTELRVCVFVVFLFAVVVGRSTDWRQTLTPTPRMLLLLRTKKMMHKEQSQVSIIEIQTHSAA